MKVLERLPTVGGRTSAIEAEGFKFDLGPTFFFLSPCAGADFCRRWRQLRDEVEMVRLDPQYRIIFGEGGELDATPDIARMEQQIAAILRRRCGGLPPFPRRESHQAQAHGAVPRECRSGLATFSTRAC